MASNLAPTDGQDEWVRRVLGVQSQANPALDLADLAELGIDLGDMWVAAREAFHIATDQVDKQISALQAALRDGDDLDYDEIAEFGLDGLTEGTRVPLQAAIMEAGSASPEKLRAAAPKIRATVAQFRAHLASDPRIAACDDNPLGVDVSIRDTFHGALDQLEDVAIAAA